MLNKNPNEYLQKLIVKAYKNACDREHSKFLLEHILYSFLTEDLTKKFFIDNNYDYDNILIETNNFLVNFPTISYLEHSYDKPSITPLIDLFMHAFLTGVKCNSELSGMPNLIKNIMITLSSFLILEHTYSERILNSNNITIEVPVKLYQKYNSEELLHSRIKPILDKILEDTPELSDIRETLQPKTSHNEGDKYLINLNKKVSSKDWIKIVGREKEIDLLEQIILRHDKPNAILVGNPGVGKTKIIEGFAKKEIERKTNLTVYQLDTLEFTSNLMLKGEIERRVLSLVNTLKEKGNAILYIDEIHNICMNDGQNVNIANLLKPMLTSNTIKVIGSTTFEEYRKYMEKDEAFTRRFYKMVIEEPSFEETHIILNKIKKNYEEYYGLKYNKESIDEIMNLTNKFIFDKHYPDKAIDLLDMVGAYCKHNNKDNIEPTDVQKVISKMRNIPLSNISQSEEDIYLHLEEKLKAKIFGQDEAVQSASDAVIISRSGLRETSKTAISLMLLGDPGVGKTELCKQLSEIMSIPLIRFDMSEYMEEHSVSKLIGSPPGYKDSGDGKAGNGLLINAIDENPHCVLLLDEIEKANSKVHNLLLQVMDNGKLTSSMGKQVSFENVFLIMTSNVGSQNSNKIGIGFGSSEDNPSQKDYELSFLPEFRNRIDKTITFNKLNEDVMKQICEKFLNELKEILDKKKIKFSYKDSIIDYIVNKTHTKENGAREMKHIITNEIKNVIAKNIVFGKYKNKNKIILSYKNKICFGD